MARMLNLEAPTPAMLEPVAVIGGEQAAAGALHTVTITEKSAMTGRQLIGLGLPGGVLVVYIQRGSIYVVPGGRTW